MWNKIKKIRLWTILITYPVLLIGVAVMMVWIYICFFCAAGYPL